MKIEDSVIHSFTRRLPNSQQGEGRQQLDAQMWPAEGETYAARTIPDLKLVLQPVRAATRRYISREPNTALVVAVLLGMFAGNLVKKHLLHGKRI